ncbi:hypothetical protein ATANTOWER_017741 [Ataeniobius toweri]|uniref:Uncharacterized protein n=1 Tax=Ataeniobius toweri TaxID=208326 RepID=A0ABU7BZP1_9TELE|nr:hypothetical protein [Ataeniobius toweri]
MFCLISTHNTPALLHEREEGEKGGKRRKEQTSSVLSVPPLAHTMASLAVYEQGEDRMALHLRVWSGCVYVCLALEPGTWIHALAYPGHHTKHR